MPATSFSPIAGTSLSDQDKYFSMLLVGPPGCGKTTMMLTAPGSTFVLDIDARIHQVAAAVDMSNIQYQQFDQSLWGAKSGSLVSTIKKINPKSAEEGMVQMADPKCFLQVVDVVNDLDKIAQKEGKLPFDNLGLDTYSRLTTHIEAYTQGQANHSWLTQSDWRAVKANHISLVTGLMSFPCNIIMTCHSKVMIDDITKEVQVVPNISGAFGNDFGSYFQEVYFLIPEITAEGKMQVKCKTRADRKYSLRSSLTDLVEVEADIEKIIRGDFRGEKAAEYFAKHRPRTTGRIVKEEKKEDIEKKENTLTTPIQPTSTAQITKQA